MLAAAGALKLPAIGLQQLDQRKTLHRVYYTHRLAIEPRTTLRSCQKPNASEAHRMSTGFVESLLAVNSASRNRDDFFVRFTVNNIHLNRPETRVWDHTTPL